MKTKSLLDTLFAIFKSELADFDNVDVHGTRVMGFCGSKEGLVQLMSRFGVSFETFIGTFPLGLKGDGLLILLIDGGRDRVHRHDAAHEGEGMPVEKYLIRTYWSEIFIRDEYF